MWVWSTCPAPSALADFARAAGLREVYLSVPWQIDPAQAAGLQSSCRALGAAGIEIAALGGDPEWADGPRDAGAWARRALSAASFDRVHLDIEPWGHPQWHIDRGRMVEGYLAALASVQAAVGTTPVDGDVALSCGTCHDRLDRYSKPFWNCLIGWL